MNKKICKKCGIEKDVYDFYVHNQMEDGRLNFCKDCVKKRVKKYAHSPHGRKVGREWFKTEKGKAKLKRHTQRFRRLNPEKYKAHQIAQNALRNGKLKKKPCEICGKKKAEKHHEDYSNPLDVKWFCRKHHIEYHKQNQKNPLTKESA